MSPHLPSGSDQAKNAYIPASIQQAMNKQLQQSMPANLKQYQGGQTYIPASAEKAMTQHMEKTMPSYMKEYITPFMHQQVTASRTAPNLSRPTNPRPPTPNLMRRDHSLGFGEQHTVAVGVSQPLNGRQSLSFSPQYQGEQTADPTPSSGSSNNYDFFLKPTPASSKRPLLRGSSLRSRLLVIGGGLLAALIIIGVGSALFGGGSSDASLVAVAQDQNELARVATEASSQAAEQTTKNLALTVELSITSAQQQLLTYLSQNGHKLSAKQLAATKDLKTDQTLTAAEAASNYDTVFAGVMQTSLQNYGQDLNTALKSTGPKGKTLLESQLSGATLLLNQAKSVASSLPSQ